MRTIKTTTITKRTKTLFSKVPMKARQGEKRQGQSGQKIIEAASSTSVLIIIWKQYEKLMIHAQGIFSQCAFPKDNFPK
jgi:hypothetical protein